jgi:hypothetical protein
MRRASAGQQGRVSAVVQELPRRRQMPSAERNMYAAARGAVACFE